MTVRLLSSAVAGVVTTAALFLLMHHLIEIAGGTPVEPRKRPLLQFVDPIEETPLDTMEYRREKIDPPPELPLWRLPRETGEKFTGARPPAQAHQSPASRWRYTHAGQLDGALMAMFQVRPDYPPIARQRGLEGHVVVRFDVSEAGTVHNIVVVESSSRIFNRAAIDAASRFKFKPKIVNGVPQSSFGIQRLFTFRMDKD